jgi:hypothetical protein
MEYGFYYLSHLQAVARIPSLKTIEVKICSPPPRFLTMINEDPKLLALIKYQTPSKATSSLKSDISELPTTELPMASASTNVQDQIWSRILKFAVEIPLEITRDLLEKLARTRWSLPLTSKRFQVSLIIHVFTGEYAQIASEARNSSSLP